MNRDLERFRQILRGKIKENFKKYISSDDLLSRRGKNVISVPLPKITLPKFRYSKNNSGVGQGKGPRAGDQAGQHFLEVDVPVEELADLLGEELQLPKIEPKGKQQLIVDRNRYRGLRRVGPESLRSFKQTFKEALKRSIASNDYCPDQPLVIPIKDDKRYRSSQPVLLPQSQALILYFMDISGSMGPFEKEIARTISFWIELWLGRNFKNLVSRYIVHDAEAREVDKESFYQLREAGGTRISSAYELGLKILQQEYSPADWNVYLFQFSDGEDWDEGSTSVSSVKAVLPWLNQLSYCQIRAGGGFIEVLKHVFKDNSKVVLAQVDDRNQVYGALKKFFQDGN